MKRKSLQLMTRLELIISILAWISALICLMLLICMIVAKADLLFLAIFSVATICCVVSGMSIFVAYKVDKRSREALSEVRQKDTDSEESNSKEQRD